MDSQMASIRVHDVDLLVEVIREPGTEETSMIGGATGAITDGLDRARDAIVGIASTVGETLDGLGERALQPDRLEVEFGLKFTMQGGIVVAGASGEATLRILLGYDRRRQS
jgi:hypothetical protein